MDQAKEDLVTLVNEKHISAVQIMANRLGIEEDEVRNLLTQLIEEGLLDGHITEDGSRFYRSNVEVEVTPESVEEEYVPDFMKYNTKPGKLVAYVGIMVMVFGGIIYVLSAANLYYQNIGMVLLLFGLIALLVGGYWIGRRKTPM